jgi:hypothetical protein
MSRFVAIHGCVAVLSAFLLGPFTHVHQSADHDADGGEEMPIVHSHVSFDAFETHESYGRSVGRAGHGEGHEISVFDFQKANRAQTPQPVAVFFHLPGLEVQGSTPEMPEAVAHAPPSVDSFGLRSPPA